MQIEKEHKKSSLMRRNKAELVEHIMCLEHNNNVLHDTINQQYKNFKAMTSWVPVKERLPEEGQIVLVTAKWGDLQIAHHCAEGWVLELTSRLFTREPRAWMPLPEPYKEDNNGELPRQTNAERLRMMTNDELKQWLQEPSND